jgi:hypothetical protein
MEEFRARLLALASLNEIRSLYRELAEYELHNPLALPYFVLASVLAELHARLSDRELAPTVWDQVCDRLRDPIQSVVDANATGDSGHIFRELNLLIRRWAQIRQELD